MAPRDLDDDELTAAAAETDPAGTVLDAVGYWATAEERDGGDTYVVDVVLEGDAADVVAALQAFDRDADDPVAALRAAYDERAAAAAAGLANEDTDGGADGHVDVDVDQDRDTGQDMTAGQGMGT
jgi:hypothetical protein